MYVFCGCLLLFFIYFLHCSSVFFCFLLFYSVLVLFEHSPVVLVYVNWVFGQLSPKIGHTSDVYEWPVYLSAKFEINQATIHAQIPICSIRVNVIICSFCQNRQTSVLLWQFCVFEIIICCNFHFCFCARILIIFWFWFFVLSLFVCGTLQRQRHQSCLWFKK